MSPFEEALALARQQLHVGDALRAEASCRDALQVHPDAPDAFFLLGLSLKQQGRLYEAAAAFRDAIRVRPDFAEAYNQLGILHAQLDQLDDAAKCLREAVRLVPQYAQGHNNLGKVLQEQDQLDEADACFRRALSLRPDYPEALYNLGVTREGQGRRGDAVTCYEQALQLRPGFAAAASNLGNALRQLGRLGDAETVLRNAVSRWPTFVAAHVNYACVCQERGHLDDAASHYHEALRLQPKEHLRLAAMTLLPPVYQSSADVDQWRERFADNLRRLHRDGVRIDLAREPVTPPFLLAYQGQNDRDLQRAFARLCFVSDKVDPPSRRRSGKIRVGFVSTHFRDHTVGRLTQGLIAQLSRADFCVSVLSVGRHDDETGRAIRQHAEGFVALPANLAAARRLVAKQELDVLYYADLGMDPFTHALAFSRLAPVQCVTWGHPVTSGIDTIDYFVSSELLEPPDASQHYTEKLVLLKTLPIYYSRPALPAPRPRSFFGLPADAPVYACPQSLFKLHPDFDAILAGILRRDPRGVVVLLHGRDPHWDELLCRRFAATLPDGADRIRFVPPLARDDFLALNATADVLLDPLHFGGGNTTYEALALGVPVVTLPSPFLRGRITLALYRRMKMLDCVVSTPAEYVDLAVRLGNEPDLRNAMKEKIISTNEVLYQNADGVRELESWLHSVTSL